MRVEAPWIVRYRVLPHCAEALPPTWSTSPCSRLRVTVVPLPLTEVIAPAAISRRPHPRITRTPRTRAGTNAASARTNALLAHTLALRQADHVCGRRTAHGLTECHEILHGTTFAHTTAAVRPVPIAFQAPLT